jgi:methionyl-tRNA formyltransferase
VIRENINKNAPLRVYFLGAGALGIAVLDELQRNPVVDCVGIGTQPDKPAGRKRRPMPSPIGAFAAQQGWEVDKPASVNSPEFLERLRECAPEIVVVVSFGQLLKRELLELPPAGCFNIHASLLPRYRGASPITAAILAGDEQAGISFMRMDAGLDTGPVYEMVSLQLDQTETAQDLEEALGRLAADHVVGCLVKVCREGLAPVAQSSDGMSYVGKLKKSDGRLDWRLPAAELERRVRAFNPWPLAWFEVVSPKRTRRIQVTAAQVCETAAPGEPGQVLMADRQNFMVACGDGRGLGLLNVVPEGKSEMTADAFLRGCQIPPGTRLT